MPELPTGTVTFLFTDLEGSTRLWEEHPEPMQEALARHDEILRTAVEEHEGHVVKTTGDGLHAAFTTAHDAVAAAVDAQRTLGRQTWPLPDPLLVRMGIHSGEAGVRDGDYYGTAVNRAARIASVAHGGQVVCSRATEELVRDGLRDITLADLGDHQLRDLARAERIFQIHGAGLDAEFPPLRSLDAFPGNLPLRTTSFVGRSKDLARIATALERSPVVTITGVGGVGKTRLAVHAAAEVVPHYRDGAWLCELATADSPTALLQVIAVSLGVPLRTGADPLHGIVEFLRNKHLLLVLDNCEHLIDASGRLAERVTRDCPDVRILATSREGLSIDGEQVVPLRSLTVPEDASDHDAVLASPAVRLFVERARAANETFSVHETDLPVLTEICHRLDGIPLAIELAAARTVAMSPTEIAELLDERFRLLTGGKRTAVERHQTLRAAVDWSYSLLDDRARAIFDRLCVFAGTFTGDAAAAVVSGEDVERFDVLDALTDLVAKSLVVAERTDDDPTRYVLLETLRQYARERLDEAGTGDHWRRRHAEYFATVSEEVAPALWTADEIPTRRRLLRDLDNLRAAVTWALDRNDRDDNELGLRIPAALYLESIMVGSAGIAEWALRALPLVDSTSPTRRHQILICVAWDAHTHGDMDGCIETALRVLEEPIPEDIAACTQPFAVLGSAYAQKGNVAEAARVSKDGLALADARGAPAYTVGSAMAVLALDYLNNGEFPEGRREAERALELAERSRNPSALTVATFALGWALCPFDPSAAIDALDRAIDLCRSGATDAAHAPALCQRAVLLLEQGDGRSAVADLRWAFERSVEIGDELHLGFSSLAAVIALSRSEMTERAAAGLGAIDAGVIFVWAPWAFPRFPVDDVRSDLRARLGDADFAAAHERGTSMTHEEAIAFIRESLDELARSVG
jgi:predicted ATPase/class 3 adenylate cyclase